MNELDVHSIVHAYKLGRRRPDLANMASGSPFHAGSVHAMAFAEGVEDSKNKDEQPMNDRLIGPGDDDYGRQPVQKFNPALGSPETKAQMEAVIAKRNIEKIEAEFTEIRQRVLHYGAMTCACGYTTIEFAFHEVASLHLCPACRKVFVVGPDGPEQDIFASMRQQDEKLKLAIETLKAADVALSRDFHPESFARRKVADTLKAIQ